ncbi:hypothetical protein BC477_09225 [Clavibacter michiganensis subsp. michiganensis]|uniref:Uncharacterized protein n=1 Tax=Clavibacter michiganensis subsp. michiganensis TaxID=33013 RepID=A0A251XN60_CLAMM|nr:hypothetical protein BC477_09225 [Clavibacter michiganensis subsp. michiganensis]OUE04905.1 hypothetical protein CMMCAS07_08145 [Clavibacter michiganensis subsp. michiganensis]
MVSADPTVRVACFWSVVRVSGPITPLAVASSMPISSWSAWMRALWESPVHTPSVVTAGKPVRAP